MFVGHISDFFQPSLKLLLLMSLQSSWERQINRSLFGMCPHSEVLGVRTSLEFWGHSSAHNTYQWPFPITIALKDFAVLSSSQLWLPQSYADSSPCEYLRTTHSGCPQIDSFEMESISRLRTGVVPLRFHLIS